MRLDSLRTLCLSATLACGAPAQDPGPRAERRIALVIGNGAYPDAPLRNPTHDAADMAGAPFAQRLLFAAMLEQFKLHAEARSHWKALTQERPEDPVLQDLASEPGESRRPKSRDVDSLR